MHSTIRKAASLGTAAALMASLMAVVAAPAALASATTTTSAGVVPVNGTSTAPASFTVCENSGGDWTGGGTISIWIADAGGNYAAPNVSFTDASGGAAAPTISAPGVLGASVAISGTNSNEVVVTISNDDGTNALCFTVGNLYITATATAAPGAINAETNALGTDTLGTTTYSASTTTATGLVDANVVNSSSVTVDVTSTCPFTDTTASNAGTYTIGSLTGLTGTAGALGTPAAGQQVLTLTSGNISVGAGSSVTQTVANCGISATTPYTLPSPGTVAAAVFQTAVAGLANPGEQNQVTGTTTIQESEPGYLAAGTVLTFTIATPGVTFSTSPTAWVTVSAGGLLLGSGTTSALCVLQYGGTSCQVTVDAPSTVAQTGGVGGSITLAGAASSTSGILLDVASTVAAGTAVNVNVTGSPAIVVNVTSNTIANSSRVIVGFGATPQIYINYNAQPSGMITLTESSAGQFQSSSSSGVDAFAVCITTGETFTYVPYAIVTTGDLMLLNPSNSTAVAANTPQVGTLYTDPSGQSCVSWTVYSASTVASTISIVGATASGPLQPGPQNGPTLSVPGSLTPGPTQMNVLVGTQAQVALGQGASTIVTNAIRAFKSGVVVTALSQPFIAPGTTGAAGNITIAETLNGQLVAGELITCRILPPVGNNAAQQAYLSAANSNMLPVVTTNTDSGLIAHLAGTTSTSFTIAVDQQAYAPAMGTITVSNINYQLVSGATNGSVTVECTAGGMATGTITEYEGNFALVTNTSACLFVTPSAGAGDFFVAGTDTGSGSYVQSTSSGYQTLYFATLPSGGLSSGQSVTQSVPNCSTGATGAPFDQFVSNAVVGQVTKTYLDESSAVGVTTTSTFTLSTKVVKKGDYITLKITTTPAMAGADIGIWVAKKGADGTWSKFSPHTGRHANGQGVVYYYYKAGSIAWLSFQAHFYGDATHAPSVSNAVQARWTA